MHCEPVSPIKTRSRRLQHVSTKYMAQQLTVYEEGFVTEWDGSIPASVARPSFSRYRSESGSANCSN